MYQKFQKNVWQADIQLFVGGGPLIYSHSTNDSVVSILLFSFD